MRLSVLVPLPNWTPFSQDGGVGDGSLEHSLVQGKASQVAWVQKGGPFSGAP